MKLKYINSLALICSALAFTGCSENSWNDTFLDGFQDGATYDNTVTVSYELTAADYQSIGQTLYNLATTQEEKDAANSIRNNFYFDQSSPYPIEVAVPYLLNKEKTNFYIYNSGSHVQVSLAVAQGVPEELNQISAAPRMILSQPASADEIVSKLSQTYPNATEGKYVVVSYDNPATKSTKKAYSAGTFIYNPVPVTKAATTVWTVAEALTQMKDGYRGEAIVKGIISEIQEISTQFGNATYFIKDALTDEESLEVFRGYGYNGDKFTSENDLAVGQAVIVSGSLVDYNGTLEFTTGSKLITESDIPGGDNPGGDNPGGENPGGNQPGGDTPGGDNPGGNQPGTGMNTLTSNIKNLAEGMELSATAMVTGVSWSGLVLSDKAGSIYYYNNKLETNDYPVGTVVRVKGTVSEYNSSYQLTNTATLMPVGEGSYIYPTPKEYNGKMIDEACASTSIVDPTYVTVAGVATKLNNSVLINVEGASAGVVIYPTANLFDKIVSGDYYTITGYYIHTTTTTTTPSKLFNVVATDVKATNYPIEEENATNVLYTFNGTNWIVAPNATVMSGDAYSKMGFNVNELSDPKLYLPNYMKQAFPYALKDTEIFVAYNLTDTGCACSLLIFNGSEWSVNDNFLYDKVADFIKNANGYTFSKYIGEELYKFYDGEKIALNCSYLIVYGNVCMDPVPMGKTYGYPGETEVEINEGSIVMTNGDNAFSFVTTTEYNGNIYTAPEGYFMILDSNGRYMYLQGTYSSFNLRSNNAYIENDGTINPGYLFTATKNEDGTWSIVNTQDIVRTLYYSDGNNDFAAYTEAQLSKYVGRLPFLYISDSSVIEDDASSEE